MSLFTSGMEARLSEIASVADQKERTAQYRDVVTECLAGGGNVEGLKAMVTHMMSDDVPLVISRQILQTLCQEVVTTLPAEQQKETAAFALEKMSPRVMSFDEQVSVLREGLSKLYQNDAEWSRAAKMLAGIDLDSGTRGAQRRVQAAEVRANRHALPRRRRRSQRGYFHKEGIVPSLGLQGAGTRSRAPLLPTFQRARVDR